MEWMETIFSEVEQALSDETIRPLTDHVQVYAAEDKEYTLNVEVHYSAYAGIDDAVTAAISEYQKSKDAAHLLEVSETYFAKTNEMVEAAQNLVDVMAVILYLLLAAFIAAVGLVLRRVYYTFQERVVEPLDSLEGSVNQLAKGHMSQKFSYPRRDEIGALYDLLNEMRTAILGYVQDIEKNLNTMAAGDLVSTTQMKYIGDYEPIQRNLNHIREALCAEMQSMGDMAEQVAVSSGEVSKVSQSLAEGAMSQNESVQDLQNKIYETMAENAKVESFVEEARESSRHTKESIENSRSNAGYQPCIGGDSLNTGNAR